MNIHTTVWKIDVNTLDWKVKLAEPAALLSNGKQIAFPTETVYGLGADARNEEAVKGIFSAKGRPSDNPLIVHIYDRSQVAELTTSTNAIAEQLMDQFWPGPLTLIVPVKPGILSSYVTAGLTTVGLRMPDHPVALELMRQAAVPIAAPSANTSGRPSPTLAAHVFDDLNGKIVGIVDGGATGVGLESTVIEVVDRHIQVLRPGGVTVEQLQSCCPEATVTLETELESKQAPRSPGMKYTHYAPTGKLVVVKGEPTNAARYINEQIEQSNSEDRCGVLCFEEHIQYYNKAGLVISLGSVHHLEQAASRLYDALRTFDEHQVAYIWTEASSTEGIGAAFMNRLVKAAGHSVVEVFNE